MHDPCMMCTSTLLFVTVWEFGSKCYCSKLVTVSTKAYCGVECGSWRFDKSLCRDFAWHIWFSYSWEHLDRLLHSAKNVCPVWMYVFTKYILHYTGNFIGLVIHWLQVQSVASKTVMSQISHHTVNITICFDVLLTVHLTIFILVINQLDAQNFCSTISLFQASTCFEHHVLIVRRAKLYYTASGIITPVGGCPVRSPLSTCAPDGHLQSATIPDAV